MQFPVSHTLFCVLFPVVLYAICNALTVGRIQQWFRLGDSLDGVALAAFLVAGCSLFVFVFTLFAHPWTTKPLAVLLTLAGAIVTYFIAKYGVAVDSSMMLNAFHTDRTEVGQLLSLQMVPMILALAFVPLLLIGAVRINFPPYGTYLWGSLKVLGGSLGLALLCLYLQYNPILRAGNVSNKYIVYQLVPINVISGTVNATTKALRPLWRRDQKQIAIDARVATPGNLVVVLAVGESSRRANFSLFGYTRRETNPELAKVPDLHLLNAVATRASTLYALPKILEKDGIKLTTVTSKAGVPTVCYVNYTLYDNCAAVGETKATNCAHGDKCYDEDVLPLLEKDLAAYKSGYRFVVLHLGGGSHGPLYGDRHPPEYKRFKPTCEDADVANKCTTEQIFNSYDNTILYVDHVLARVVNTLDTSKVPYVLVYLSDHGESLGEGGNLFHGMPPGMTLPAEQSQIPLIVKASVPVTIAARAEVGQPDVFDSVLNLFAIESPFDKAGSFISR